MCLCGQRIVVKKPSKNQVWNPAKPSHNSVRRDKFTIEQKYQKWQPNPQSHGRKTGGKTENHPFFVLDDLFLPDGEVRFCGRKKPKNTEAQKTDSRNPAAGGLKCDANPGQRTQKNRRDVNFSQRPVQVQILLPECFAELRPAGQQSNPAKNDVGVKPKIVELAGQQFAAFCGKQPKFWVKNKVNDWVKTDCDGQKNKQKPAKFFHFERLVKFGSSTVKNCCETIVSTSFPLKIR